MDNASQLEFILLFFRAFSQNQRSDFTQLKKEIHVNHNLFAFLSQKNEHK